MADETTEPQELETPEELLSPEGGNRYEKYRKDGVYEYGVLPNGKADKTHVKITYNAGDVFEGILKRGKYIDTGKYWWKDGGTYEGSFRDGKLNGRGKYAGVSGGTYEGNFKDGSFDGNGKYIWADGSFFEGSFKNGQLSDGRFTDANGNVYACSYTYNRNGERKSGEVRLIRKAAPKTQQPAAKEQASGQKTERKTERKDDGLQNKDRVLLARIRGSVEGEKFKKLYAGEDKSVKAEEKLLKILGFFTNYDEVQMERIYKSSKLYAAKGGDVQSSIAAVKEKKQNFVKSAETAAKTNAKAKAAQSSAGAAK